MLGGQTQIISNKNGWEEDKVTKDKAVVHNLKSKH